MNEELFVLPRIDILRRLDESQGHFVWNAIGSIDFSIRGGNVKRQARGQTSGTYTIEPFETDLTEYVAAHLSDGTIIEIHKEVSDDEHL